MLSTIRWYNGSTAKSKCYENGGNGTGFLEMFCPNYRGQSFYIDAPSVSDGSLITASGTGALLWAKQIIEYLGVFRPDTLDAWYAYFSTGEARHFFALMQTLPSANG